MTVSHGSFDGLAVSKAPRFIRFAHANPVRNYVVEKKHFLCLFFHVSTLISLFTNQLDLHCLTSSLPEDLIF